MYMKLILLLYLQLFGFASGQLLESENPSSRNASYFGEKLLSNTRAKVVSQEQNFQDIDTNRTVRVDPHWSTQLPVLPLVFASSTTLPEGRCKKQARRYLNDLANSTLWAVQMFDASTKYPDGVIYGNVKHLGNFDQCYDLQAKLPPVEDHLEYEDEVEGRYCLIRFRYQRKDVVPETPESLTLDFNPNLSVWNAINERGDFRRVKRNSVYMALCVPASCTPEEVSTALTEPLEKLAEAWGLRLETTVRPSFCQARRDVSKHFSTGTKAYCFIIAALIFLVMACSWYDSSIYSSEDVAVDKNGLDDFFLCFSARRNLRSIFLTVSNHRGLDCIHMFRFFFTSLTITGHRAMQYYGHPIVDSTRLEKAYTLPFSTMVLNGTIAVDAFFSIGGLLLAYGLIDELDRRKRLRFTALILVRFLRLTPLYMAAVFFHATLLPRMGSGPFWETRIGSDRDYCSKNWWTNLLYINNYVNPSELCMFQSWYLSVDFHLYILGLFVIWAFWKLPRRLGYPFIGTLIAIGIAIPFFTTYANNIQPLFRGFPFMADVRRDPYFLDYYIKSHMRIGPYMVGVLAGILIYDHKGSSWRLSKVWSRLLFVILSVGLMIGSQSLGAKYYDPNSVLDPLETAAYAGFHRAAFAFGTCSIFVLITIGDGLDFHYNFMTPNWIQPLARLTYGAFLVHNINQGYEIGVTRSPRVISAHNAFWDLVPDIVYTFSLSLLLSVVVEGPIRRIEKFVLSKRLKRTFTNGSSSVDPIKGIIKKTN